MPLRAIIAIHDHAEAERVGRARAAHAAGFLTDRELAEEVERAVAVRHAEVRRAHRSPWIHEAGDL